ncbi:MAG: hypothetical protein HXS44_11295 [Theionarchaea archaeon]|nr:hypothetical protein [Theionarchaea archaeon]
MPVKAVYVNRIDLSTATGPVRVEGEGLHTTQFWPFFWGVLVMELFMKENEVIVRL